MTGEKSELHQPSRVILRQIQTVQDSRLPMFQFHEVGGLRVVFREPNLFDSRLHIEPSIYLEYCNITPLGLAAIDIHLQLAFKLPSIPKAILSIHHLGPNWSGIH